MSIKIHIDLENQFLLENWQGDIHLDHLYALANKIPKVGCFTGMRILFELDRANLLFNVDDLRRVNEHLIENQKVIGKTRWAFISEDFRMTAMIMMFRSFSEPLPVAINVFSTQHAALSWLDVDHCFYMRSKNHLHEVEANDFATLSPA